MENGDNKYLPQLLAEKDSLDSSFTHAMKLLEAGKTNVLCFSFVRPFCVFAGSLSRGKATDYFPVGRHVVTVGTPLWLQAEAFASLFVVRSNSTTISVCVSLAAMLIRMVAIKVALDIFICFPSFMERGSKRRFRRLVRL